MPTSRGEGGVEKCLLKMKCVLMSTQVCITEVRKVSGHAFV